MSIHKRCIVKGICRQNTKEDQAGKIIVKYAIDHCDHPSSSGVGDVGVGSQSEEDKAEGPLLLHELHADMVLVTLPLGVLQQSVSPPKAKAKAKTEAEAADADAELDKKKAAISFSPPLSAAKQHAVHALGMGLENKVLRRFPLTTTTSDSDSTILASDELAAILNR